MSPAAQALLEEARSEAEGDDALAAQILAEVAAVYLRAASAAAARARWPRDAQGYLEAPGETHLVDNPSEVYPRQARPGGGTP